MSIVHDGLLRILVDESDACDQLHDERRQR